MNPLKSTSSRSARGWSCLVGRWRVRSSGGALHQKLLADPRFLSMHARQHRVRPVPRSATTSVMAQCSSHSTVQPAHATHIPDLVSRRMIRFGAWRISDLHLTDDKYSVTAMKPCRHHLPCLRNGGLGPQGALPDCSDSPARLPKSGLNCYIPHHICIELGPPELGARCRNRGVAAACVAMPEATMHEDDGSNERKLVMP